MAIAKRILLFLVVNIFVVLTISIILNLLNIQPYLSKMGLNLPSLAIFCLVWGMGGALISLFLSKTMAKWFMGVKIISKDTQNMDERALLRKVDELARRANLPKTPDVGIYNSPEVNAFATGATKRSSLVAVSTGLLEKMEDRAVEAVLGHELTHISSGDMVTMTLLQGVINAFVMFLARVLAFALSGVGRNSDGSRNSYASFRLFVFLFEFLFMILGSLVICAFSRYREFRADRGGARLSGRENMIYALQSLENFSKVHDPSHEKAAFQSFKISTPSKKGFLYLFATHPPIEERIARLRQVSSF